MAAARNKRIIEDIKELARAPVERAAAAPSDEDDPSVFHANVWPVPGSSWDGAAPVHFVITCGSNYPFVPPSVQCMINYPHPNVISNNQGKFMVCLDMLEPYTSTSRPYECWSSAFSIRSILVQLTSFILCDTSTDHVVSNADRVRAMLEANTYESKGAGGCGHSAKHPVPSCPSLEDLRTAACSSSSTSLPVAMATSRFHAAMENLFSTRIHSMTTSITTTAPTTLALIVDDTEEENVGMDGVNEVEACDVSVDTRLTELTAAGAASITHADGDVEEEEEEAWTVVKRTSCVKIQATSKAKSKTVTKGTGRARLSVDTHDSSSLLNLFASGSGQPVLTCSTCGKERRRNAFSRSQLEKGTGRRCQDCIDAAISKPVAAPVALEDALKLTTIAHNASVVGYAAPVTSSGPPVSKKAEKHRRRKERARMQKLAKLTASKNDDEDEASVGTHAPSLSSTTTTTSITAPASACIVTSTANSTVSSTPPSTLPAPPSVAPSRMWTLGWGAGSAAAAANLGAFKHMSRSCTAQVMSFLGDHHNVLSWGTTCRAAAGAAEDNWVWQALLRQRFPHAPSLFEDAAHNRTSMPPGSMKMSFILELNGLSTEPSCFVTRASRHDNEVLGFGFEHTSNPKTGVVDYITTCGDYLAASAYKYLKVRRSAWGENAKDFTGFLPVFLDEEHFEKSGGHKLLLLAARKLAPLPLSTGPRGDGAGSGSGAYVPPHRRGSNRSGGRAAALLADEKASELRDVFTPKSEPEAALEMLLTMWKTIAIQIVDKGLAPSDKLLEVFCQLHRLMIALRERYPSLKSTIHKRLHTFATNPASRCKSACPNLGQLIPLLVVSDTYEWRHIATAYLQESYDRSVLWACTKDSSLAKMDTGDESRIDRMLEATLVSQRMTAFNVSMVHVLRPPMHSTSLGNGNASSLEQARDGYDICLGRPPLHLRRAFHSKVRAVLEADTWGKLFGCLRTALPPKRAFLSILESAVKNSLKKGYHDVNTRFDCIHRSGVSHILLKGESYSAPPNLKRVRLTDRWKLDGDVDFLDASCFVYAGPTKIGMVDYSCTHWGADESASLRRIGHHERVFELYNTSHDCVVHSGDNIDHGNNIGEHTIDIDLTKLPKRVTALVFTISAWHGALEDAIQPQCVLSDAGSAARTELCSYELEGTGPRRYGADDLPPTAAVMCTLTRAEPGASRWSMNAIGHQGQGRATGRSPGYGPMLQDIDKGRMYEHDGGVAGRLTAEPKPEPKPEPKSSQGS